MKYKYLLFDLDGTLFDTMEGVVKCTQHALSHFNIIASLKELEIFMGPPLRYSFMTHYGLSEEQATEAIKIYRDRYELIGWKESTPFKEIPSLLAKLKSAGYILGVATSKYEGHARKMLEYHDLAKHFDYITGANHDESISKKHEVIAEALKRFGISENYDDVLMIGDMRFDIIGAKAVGIDSYGIYTGTAKDNEHEDAGATYIAYSFNEFEKVMLEDLYN